jgi:hypothetical protein
MYRVSGVSVTFDSFRGSVSIWFSRFSIRADTLTPKHPLAPRHRHKHAAFNQS